MKISDLEQGSRAFKWQYWKIDVLSPIPAFILTLVYLGLMFDLELSERLVCRV